LTVTKVPLVIYNAAKTPEAASFRNNIDLARWSYPGRTLSDQKMESKSLK